ncbi:MAG: hypothetical protein AAFU57_03725 [Bacteroidota bacterium]
MKPFSWLFQFYLDSSIHVGFSVASLTAVTSFMLNIPLNGNLLFFQVLATVVGYSFIKYGVEAKKYWLVSKKYYRYIRFFSVVCFLGSFYFLAQLHASVWYGVVVLGFLTLLYAIPFLGRFKNLRNVGGFKIFMVSLIWSGFTVMLPVLEADLAFGWDIGVVAVQRFLLVFVLILPFDIRDMEKDSPSLQTVPQRLGIQKTVWLGITLSLLVMAMTFLKDSLLLIEIAANVILTVMLIKILLQMKPSNSKYFAAFWVEGIPIFWALVWLFSEEKVIVAF